MSPFSERHIGPQTKNTESMLSQIGLKSLDELILKTVPDSIRSTHPIDLPSGVSEQEVLNEIKTLAQKNKIFKSYIGQGYYGTHTPFVILRNILENPSWYTAYTPYQPEISQGRLEALINFQTMMTDLTGMEITNASLLDEGTAAAEAMTMAFSLNRKKKSKFFVDSKTFPQTIEILKTRSEPIGIELVIDDLTKAKSFSEYFGVFAQNPNSMGDVLDLTEIISQIHNDKSIAILACDPLSMAIFKSPGEMGADIVIGSTQRLGVPMGFGGPHAAFLSTRHEFSRNLPGRLVGVTKDSRGGAAFRLALQTREQHIRREKATSNICTAQVLLAVMASMYGVYHGPEGIKNIALTIRNKTARLENALEILDYEVLNTEFFDTISIQINAGQRSEIQKRALQKEVNLCYFYNEKIVISIDETTTEKDLSDLIDIFNLEDKKLNWHGTTREISKNLTRNTKYMQHPVFNSYHSETEMLRYITRLQKKDLTLADAMIPLGSCTMKLNATAEMIPVTWPEFGNIHPFAPLDQCQGYIELIKDLEKQLARITGFSAISLQPNAGSQGEFAGLLVIREYFKHKNETQRNICLIPSSAHGTNPASAVMAGFEVVIVNCDNEGNIDLKDLKSKAELHSKNLAALMVTYPSTHGVFEEDIKEICSLIHRFGGQVYMDGANMNAQVGVCFPGEFGPDVSHLNLHKTFCIPHGGGGPGVGPIGVSAHLAPYLPKHSVVPEAGPKTGISAISAAPWGSACILPIPWAYIKMMGAEGLKNATSIAILNANYVANKLKNHFPILYKGKNGFVAHECILDVRQIKSNCDIGVDDIAKRLMDFGFHAPTMSWPVVNTLMVEPTESESQAELDRFCEAMIQIRKEIKKVESGEWDKEMNPLRQAPHTVDDLTGDWNRSYTRSEAFYPLSWVKDKKFIVSVNRIDNVYGDKNLVCQCPSPEEYR